MRCQASGSNPVRRIQISDNVYYGKYYMLVLPAISQIQPANPKRCLTLPYGNHVMPHDDLWPTHSLPYHAAALCGVDCTGRHSLCLNLCDPATCDGLAGPPGCGPCRNGSCRCRPQHCGPRRHGPWRSCHGPGCHACRRRYALRPGLRAVRGLRRLCHGAAPAHRPSPYNQSVPAVPPAGRAHTARPSAGPASRASASSNIPEIAPCRTTCGCN